MLNKKVIKIIWLSLLLVSGHLLSMESNRKNLLTNVKFQEIIKELQNNEISPEQKKKILSVLGSPIKRLFEIDENKENIPNNVQKDKKPRRIPKGALYRTSIGNGQNFFYSPLRDSELSPEYAIYAWTAIKGDLNPYVKHEDRINFGTILNRDGEDIEINEKNLDEALSKVECKIRQWIRDQPQLYYKTSYVGLSKNAIRRAQEHSRDLKKLSPEDDETDGMYRLYANRKLDDTDWLNNEGYDLRMSTLVYNIPPEYLKILEVLLGLLFNVLVKANTYLGDKAAWNRVAYYHVSSIREETLKKAKVSTIIENFGNEIKRKIMGINQY